MTNNIRFKSKKVLKDKETSVTESLIRFLLFINDLLDDVICNIAICADDTTLYSKYDQASDLWQQLELASELESNLRNTMDWGRKWLVDFNSGKLNWFCVTDLITLVLLMWKWMGLFLSKNHLLRCWCWLSLLNWIGALIIISIAQTSSKKVGALIHSMTFLSPGAALYLYKSTIRPYCCHIWAGAPSCYLELLEKLQKRIYRTIGPSLAASLELLAHRWNVARLSLL